MCSWYLDLLTELDWVVEWMCKWYLKLLTEPDSVVVTPCLWYLYFLWHYASPSLYFLLTTKFTHWKLLNRFLLCDANNVISLFHANYCRIYKFSFKKIQLWKNLLNKFNKIRKTLSDTFVYSFQYIYKFVVSS